MKSTLLFIFVVWSSAAFSQGVTIGSPNPPDGSAVLDLQANNQGFLMPRVTQAQRNAIQNPAQGLMLFNTTTECVDVFFTGSGWQAIGCNCTAPPPVPSLVTGSATVCAGSQQVMYVVAQVPGAVSYTWSADPGISIASGQGNDTVYVNFSAGSGNIYVSSQNNCGSSANYSYAVSVAQPSANFTANPSPGYINAAISFSATQPGLNYTWTFPSGSPANASVQNPSVTWTSAGTYSVQLIVSDNNGCGDTVSQNFVVNNCGPGGGNTASFTYVGTTSQTWTVPACVTSITIDARGAQGGGNPGYSGGLGARMVGTFSVTPGQVITLYVGGMGSPGTTASGFTGGGGGGGSGAFLNGNILVIAGGGGGAGHSNGGQPGQTTQNGSNGFGYPGSGGPGGTAGADGGNNSGNTAGGGKGYNSGIPSQTNGYNNPGGWGCGGGGGGSHTNGHAGGGGGGYSGGGGAWNGGAGGGGSINNGTSPTNTQGFQTGNGAISITY